MTSSVTLLLSILVISGCATDEAAFLSRSRSVFENIERLKNDDPKHFAFRLGWIDFSDGVDREEARAIADLYFDNWRAFDGALLEQKLIGHKWRFQYGVGFGGTHIPLIWVAASTGSVWQDGGERIEGLSHIISTARGRPNKAPEPTP